MNVNNRMWVLGSTTLAAVILVAGWFLGISPVLAASSASAEQRAESIAQNEVHAAAVVSLEQRFEKIDELKSALDGQRKLVPNQAEIPALLGQIFQVQTAAGVTMTDFSLSDPVPYAPAAVPEEVPEEMQTDAQGETAIVQPVMTSSPLITGENFVAVPVSLSVVGGLDQVMTFVSGLQNGDRLFLVNDLSLAEDSEQASFTGSVSGFIYVLLDDTVASTTPAAPATPSEATTAAAD